MANPHLDCGYTGLPATCSCLGPGASLGSAAPDLDLDHLFVIYPGDERYPLAERISALPVSDLPALPKRLADGALP